jgi:hypothetical protein
MECGEEYTAISTTFQISDCNILDSMQAQCFPLRTRGQEFSNGAETSSSSLSL